MKQLLFGACALALTAGAALATEIVERPYAFNNPSANSMEVVHYTDLDVVCFEEDKHTWGFGFSCYTSEKMGEGFMSRMPFDRVEEFVTTDGAERKRVVHVPELGLIILEVQRYEHGHGQSVFTYEEFGWLRIDDLGIEPSYRTK
ncbi:MAG: hypothetical protein VX730_06145 [Pseudomonadota bacterium]|nr:hypothetical protein [Pseudomonadota bacterium]